MIKFSSNSDYDFGIDSTGVLKDVLWLQKRGAAKHFLKIAKTKGQTDLHIIAVGSYEGTGFNRNGDCFKDYWCEKNAHYFKDSDRCVHRHHKNKPEDPKYGNVKAASWNAPMKRIELVVGLDDDKCGDIIQEQEKVGHTNWSMASKQAYDICTACNHKASTDDDRCEHIPDKIGEITKEGQMIGMDNPNPRWFEISYVRRPADRIGMSLGKVASDRSLRPMLTRDFLQIYTGFQAPADDMLISKSAADKRSIANKCADIEKHIAAVGTKIEPSKKIVVTDKIASELMDDFRKMEPSRFFKLAADQGIILSPENFAGYLFGDRIKEAAVQGLRAHLPNIFTDIEKDAEHLHNEKYEPSSLAICSIGEKNTIKKIAMSHSLNPAYANARIVTAKEVVKTSGAEDYEFTKELAKQYTAYKIAALNYIDQNGKLTDELLFNAVLQNRS